jgi:PAS domain S-box-containing protein
VYILYVEDDALDVELTGRELARNAPQHRLECVDSLRAARSLLEMNPERYDLVMVDINLPDGSGAELLGTIRSRGLPLAVVVITGQGDQETAAAMLKAGAEDYIVKQQDYLRHLPNILESALSRYRGERARRSKPLRVLYADTDVEGFIQAQRHLARFAPHIQINQVHSGAEILTRLDEIEPGFAWDALVIDYSLPDTNALDVLKEIQEVRQLSIPVLVVTGSGSEEIATQALKLGAADYLVKNPGYLYQLPSTIEQAVSRVRLVYEQNALHESEARFRRLAENAPDLIFRLVMHPVRRFDYVSPITFPMLGFSPEEFYADGNILLKVVAMEDRGVLQKILEGRTRAGEPITLRWVRKDTRQIWVELRLTNVLNPDGLLVAIEGIARDVTGQREVEAEMQRQLQRLASLRSIDQAISNSFDLKLVLVVLIDKVTSELKVDAASILLYNPVSQMLEHSAGTGFRSRLVDGMKMRVGEPYAGLAMYERRTIQFPDADLPEPSRDASRLIAEEDFVAGLYSPLITKGEVKGVLQVFSRTPIIPEPSWLGFLEVLSSQAAIAIDNAELFERLQRSNQELSMAYESLLEGWVRTEELRDKEMRGHNQRVTLMTLDLAEMLRVAPEDLISIRRGALLHDIGKMGIPDAILHKTGPLSDDEWQVMRLHPRHAFDLLAPVPFMDKVIDIPYCHHEKWDGSGYPRGLKGESIPFSARIFAVVDVWDAMTQDQVYRKAWPRDKALDYIREQSGKHFDPEVVRAFLKLMG